MKAAVLLVIFGFVIVPLASAADDEPRCIKSAHWKDAAPAFWSDTAYEACMAASKIGTEQKVCGSGMRYLAKNGTRVHVHSALLSGTTMVTALDGPHAGEWGIVGVDDIGDCPAKPIPKVKPRRTGCQVPPCY